MHEPTIDLRLARPSDAGGIVDLFRSGFAAQLVELTIYGAPGIERYVAEQIAIQETLGETFYVVASCSAELIGAAEMRQTPNGWLLNYIAVQAAFRGSRVASRLLGRALACIRTVGGNPLRSAPSNAGERREGPDEMIQLDVLEDNDRARGWYGRLGFAPASAANWWTLPRPVEEAVPFRVSGYAQAQVCQGEYGFSRFALVSPDGMLEVGCLGARWYRISDLRLLSQPSALATLARLDPLRELLVLAPDSWRPGCPSAQRVARTLRLQTSMHQVRVSLGKRGSWYVRNPARQS